MIDIRADPTAPTVVESEEPSKPRHSLKRYAAFAGTIALAVAIKIAIHAMPKEANLESSGAADINVGEESLSNVATSLMSNMIQWMTPTKPQKIRPTHNRRKI